MEEDLKGEIWKIEKRKIHPFIQLCTQILSDDPLFFLINSYTTGLQPAVLSYMLNTELVEKAGGKVGSTGNRTSCIIKWVGTSVWCFRQMGKTVKFDAKYLLMI